MTDDLPGSHAHANRLLREAVEENGELRRQIMELRALNDRLAAGIARRDREIRALKAVNDSLAHSLERIDDQHAGGGHA